MTIPTTAVSHQWFGTSVFLREQWQDAPDCVPRDPTGSWLRRHGVYTADELAGGRA